MEEAESRYARRACRRHGARVGHDGSGGRRGNARFPSTIRKRHESGTCALPQWRRFPSDGRVGPDEPASHRRFQGCRPVAESQARRNGPAAVLGDFLPTHRIHLRRRSQGAHHLPGAGAGPGVFPPVSMAAQHRPLLFRKCAGIPRSSRGMVSRLQGRTRLLLASRRRGHGEGPSCGAAAGDSGPNRGLRGSPGA